MMRKNVKKRILAVLLTASLISTGGVNLPAGNGTAGAAGAGTGASFKIKNLVKNVSSEISEYGYRHIDVDIPGIHESAKDSGKLILRNGKKKAASTLESRYSSYEAGYLPAVRDQGYFSICWSFGANAAMEASMLKHGFEGYTKEDIDLSELQLAYYMYNRVADPLGLTEGDKTVLNVDDSYLNLGGNNFYTSPVLTSWLTPHAESTDPKSYAELAESVKNAVEAYMADHEDATGAMLNEQISKEVRKVSDGLTFDTVSQNVYGADVGHVQDYFIFDTEDTAEIKQAIKDFGALSMDYCDDDAYYNGNAFYYSGDWVSAETDPENFNASNHTIALIGWDDNYDRTNFKDDPGMDGAWICRNSWGPGDEEFTHVDENGNMYISYADKSFLNDNFLIAYNVEPANNYAYNYQYDGTGYADTAYGGQSEMTYGDIFTVQGDHIQEIDAVGLGVASTNTDYTIEIYKNVTGNVIPTQGTLVSDATTTGTKTYYGFQTIKLKKPVVVEPGEQYSVVVTLKNKDAVYAMIDVDENYPENWIGFSNKTQAGHSFVLDGSTWYDFATNAAPGLSAEARIKAYANDLNIVTELDLTNASVLDGVVSGAVVKVSKDSVALAENTYSAVYTYADGKVTAAVTLQEGYAGTLVVSAAIDSSKVSVTASPAPTLMPSPSATVGPIQPLTDVPQEDVPDGQTETTPVKKASQAVLKVSKKTIKRGKTYQIQVQKKNGQTVSFSVTSKTKKKGVSVSSAGKVKVSKKAKTGSYTVTVKVKANSSYRAKTLKFTVKVKKSN